MKFTLEELVYLDKLLLDHITIIFQEVMNSDDKTKEKNKIQSILAVNESSHRKIQELLKSIDK